MTPKSEMNIPSLHLTSGSPLAKIPISHKDVTESHLTLGVYLTPTAPIGNMQQHYQQLLEKSNMCAMNVLNLYLTRVEAYLA